jgi:hypothetical protein
MPQFDFYSWASVGFWTILVFQMFYLLVLRFIVCPVAEYQKAFRKLHGAINTKDVPLNLVDVHIGAYLKN